MAEKSEVNHYHLILGLAEDVTAPDHYQLLGLTPFESDSSTIQRATVSRNQELLKWMNSQYHQAVDRLMDEIVAAREILVDGAAKQRYDEGLRGKYPVSVPLAPKAAASPKRQDKREKRPSPVVASADGLTGAAQEIAALCKQLRHNDYAVADQIPPATLESAAKSLAILRGERVIAFVDCTLQATGEEGMAFCETGIYWRSGKVLPEFITWLDLFSESVKPHGEFAIALGEVGIFDLSGSGCDRDWLLRRLKEMQVLAGHHVSSNRARVDDSQSSPVANLGTNSSVADHLQKLCAGQEHPDFYLGEGAPVDGDRVVAFVDCTRRGTGEQGMAICEKGLYWRNAKQAPQFISWPDLCSVGVKSEGAAAIAIGKVGTFDMANTECERDWLVGFLSELQVQLLIGDHSPSDNAATNDAPAGPPADSAVDHSELGKLQNVVGSIDQPDYLVGNDIPPEILQSAIKSYGVLRGEVVIAIVEASYMGNGEAGMAICETGLYWRNEKRSAGFTPWVDFVSATLKPVAGDAIVLGDEGTFQLAASGCNRDLLLRMLSRLQQLVREEGLG